MVKRSIIAIIVAIVGVAVVALSQTHHDIFQPNNQVTQTSAATECNKSLWDHVYNPQRLEIIDPCKTVTGTVDNIRVERDGDFHIRLKLDSQYADLINDANVNQQHGDLVLEPICQNSVEQEDAIDSCTDFSYHVDIPPVGAHVRVTGSYVLDKQHDGWAEIHPVTKIEKISQ